MVFRVVLGGIVILAAIFGLASVNWQSVGSLFSRTDGAPTPTELAIDTPTPFQLSLPPLVTPTREVVQPTATPEAPPALFVSGLDGYQDSAGLFEVAFDPGVQGGAAWRIVEESQGGVVFEEAGGLITFTVQTVNTAYALDPASISRLVDAEEQRAVHPSTGDVQRTRLEDADQQAVTVTTMYWVGAERRVRLATYRPFDSLVAISALTLPEERYHSHPDWAAQLFAAVTFYPENAANQPAYARVFTATDPLEQISILIPEGWSGGVTSGEFTWVASYYSPDLHAAIQLLTYDDGKSLEDEVVDNLALFLLNTYLSTDAMVMAYRGLPDGIEQLEWRSPRYDFTYVGTSSYSRLGTRFVMLTVMHDVAHAELYLPILQQAQESFRVPIAAPELEE